MWFGIFKKKRKERQTLFIWCDCGNELCNSNSFINDTYIEGQNVVHYICSNCKRERFYNFDIAPLPIPWKLKDSTILKYLNMVKNDK